MNKVVLIALGIGGVAALALAASPAKKSGVPTGPWSNVRGFPIDYDVYMKLTAAARGGEDEDRQQGFLLEYFHAPTIQVALSQLPDEITRLERQAFAEFAKRQRLLPKDASPAQDKYSKQRFIALKFNTGSVDEFGRPLAGLPANFGSTVLRVAQEIAPYIPVYGPAISAGITYAVAIGQGKSLKEAAISAAREYVYANAGPAARVAFDMGVGVASGESVSDAATSATLNEMEKQYPGSKDAYSKGKAAYRRVKS